MKTGTKKTLSAFWKINNFAMDHHHSLTAIIDVLLDANW